MEERTSDYYNDAPLSRTSRNQNLYKEIGKTELEGYEVRSNEAVIGDNRGSIDVEKIKSILDTHYKDAPKRRSINIEKPEEVTKQVEETKEYDINIILDKAKEAKEDVYEKERNKKLRNTGFDILNGLDLNEKEESSHKISEQTSEELTNLINTISLNENAIKKINDEDPLSLFEDLKGSEHTQVLEGIHEDLEKTKETVFEQISKDEKDESKENTTSLDKSFFTQSTKFKKDDFEDFSDIEDGKSSVFVKIIIVLLILAFVAGAIILVKSFL